MKIKGSRSKPYAKVNMGKIKLAGLGYEKFMRLIARAAKINETPLLDKARTQSRIKRRMIVS